MRTLIKRKLAQNFPRYRSSRHVLANLRYPTLSFDERIVRATHRRYYGHEIDLENPKTLSEKLNWLKFNHRPTLYTQVADKWHVRDYVRDKGLGHLLVDVHGVFEHPNEIDFSALPDGFALKATHGSSMNIIKHPHEGFDADAASCILDSWMQTDMSTAKGEWQYRDIPRRIMVEHYLECDTGDLTEYKFHCFHGEPEFVAVIADRRTCTRKSYFSLDWEVLQFRDKKEIHPADDARMPDNMNDMIAAARVLSQDFPTVRVDFLVGSGDVHFSELTLYTYGGFPKFDPPEQNTKLGELLNLDHLKPASSASLSMSSQTLATGERL
ncbi:MAG: ATP-grasp fold amidoligase family protein [Hyphomicrobiales bacterium]